MTFARYSLMAAAVMSLAACGDKQPEAAPEASAPADFDWFDYLPRE